MVILELFAGTRSIGKAFEAQGHTVYSVDWDKKFENIDLYADIGTLTAEQVIELCGGVRPDVIWASPDCTTYSIAGIRFHRRKLADGTLSPVSEYAAKCDEINKHVIELIEELRPQYWFIENPRGCMRKMDFMDGLPRYTITYCQYGDFRMKPTDIWTNHPAPGFKPPCKNGAPCHEASPRGSNAGTQRLRNKVDRSRIPDDFCRHVVAICEGSAEQNRIEQNRIEIIFD